jgi:EAL domain-containing protein (putative c-di-GMP-specific phosphodiesterase class I)
MKRRTVKSQPFIDPTPAALRSTRPMFALAAEDSTMELEMPAALCAGEFIPYYQPLMSSSGEIRGCEALMRWQRADGSFISPVDFIPVAERSGFIDDLGTFVLRAAVKQLREFEEAGLEHLYMSVNVSPRQLEHPDFETVLSATLQESGVAPSRLVLELTEGLSLGDSARMQELLDRIAATGVRLALDDYGTGYSSLGYLKSYPVSTVKIDRSFIKGIGDDSVSGIIVRAIIDLSKALQLDIVAEGVETEAQAQLLHDMGVNYLQGFLYGKPMPPDELMQRYGPAALALN